MKKLLILTSLLFTMPLNCFAFAIQNNSISKDPIGISIDGDSNEGHYASFIKSGERDPGWYLNDTINLTAQWDINQCIGIACPNSDRSITLEVPAHALVCVTGNYDNDRRPTLSIC